MIELSQKPYDVVDFTTLTAATTTVISLADAKNYLRIDGDEEDTLVYSLLLSATDAAEKYTWLQTNTVTLKTTLTYLPRYIKFWVNPIQSISSVKYFDKDNEEQTLNPSKYSFSTIHGCGVICVRENIETYNRLDAVNIEFVAGFGSNTPNSMITAIQLLLNHYYEHREAVTMGQSVEMPLGVQYLLDMIKIKSI